MHPGENYPDSNLIRGSPDKDQAGPEYSIILKNR
jgi:hypothetical protein